MSARCAKALIGAVPRRFFGSFLIAQKGTTPNKTRPTGEGRGNHMKRVQDGRRGKAQLCTKFFAKLSFKKAEVLLSTFFSEKSRRSRPRIGTRAPKKYASWCHPISEQGDPVPFGPCVAAGGTAPVSGPAGSAVFLRAISLKPFQPWGFSLSGGNRTTHAPSWRLWCYDTQNRGKSQSFCLTGRKEPGWGS